VTVGTVFERSHVPLHKWLYATHLLTSSKKGISSHQLHRMLGVTYKTAWFMTHRIREAMRPASLTPMGGGGKTVEIDETAQGRVEGAPQETAGRAAALDQRQDSTAPLAHAAGRTLWLDRSPRNGGRPGHPATGASPGACGLRFSSV